MYLLRTSLRERERRREGMRGGGHCPTIDAATRSLITCCATARTSTLHGHPLCTSTARSPCICHALDVQPSSHLCNPCEPAHVLPHQPKQSYFDVRWVPLSQTYKPPPPPQRPPRMSPPNVDNVSMCAPNDPLGTTLDVQAHAPVCIGLCAYRCHCVLAGSLLSNCNHASHHHPQPPKLVLALAGRLALIPHFV